MQIRPLICGVAAIAALGSSLGAQDTTARRDREDLRRRFQERFGAMIKDRLQLTDSQVVRLGETNRRFEEQRRLLTQQERDVRMALRDELLVADQSRINQERVSSLLDRTIRVQRQRVELLESEQRELARFLDATQRAKLLGMQEQIRRNVGEMRGRRGPPPGMIRERMRDSGPPRMRRPIRERPPI